MYPNSLGFLREMKLLHGQIRRVSPVAATQLAQSKIVMALTTLQRQAELEPESDEIRTIVDTIAQIAERFQVLDPEPIPEECTPQQLLGIVLEALAQVMAQGDTS